jgi:hypothetical protein
LKKFLGQTGIGKKLHHFTFFWPNSPILNLNLSLLSHETKNFLNQFFNRDVRPGSNVDNLPHCSFAFPELDKTPHGIFHKKKIPPGLGIPQPNFFIADGLRDNGRNDSPEGLPRAKGIEGSKGGDRKTEGEIVTFC